MQLNQHPDFCRTIKAIQRPKKRRKQIAPSQRLIDLYTKVIGKIKVYTHSFSYHVTKGWRMIARDWRG